jgi:hypothetical protein
MAHVSFQVLRVSPITVNQKVGIQTSFSSSKRLLSDFNFSVISCCDLGDKGTTDEGADGTADRPEPAISIKL